MRRFSRPGAEEIIFPPWQAVGGAGPQGPGPNRPPESGWDHHAFVTSPHVAGAAATNLNCAVAASHS